MRLEPRGDFFKRGFFAGDEDGVLLKLAFCRIENIPVTFEEDCRAGYAGSFIAIKKRMTRYNVARI